MKKRFVTRAVSLLAILMLLVGILTLTGCSNTNPASKYLKEYQIGADGETLEITVPPETESASGPAGSETAESTEPGETGETGEPSETEAPTEPEEETGPETGSRVDESKLNDSYKLGFFDYVKLPFSYLLRWLYDFTQSYGWALILFALIVKIILLPASAKSKKGMMKMSRLTPKVKALEEKYGDDKQAYQMEVNKLYREEGASGCGGCIWSLLPLLILIPLYEIIREPITWLMFHGKVSELQLGQIQNVLLRNKVSMDIKNVYWQMQAIPFIKGGVKEEMQVISQQIVSMNTKFLGIELATIPKFLFWKNTDQGWWNAIGQFLLPIISGGMNLISMWVSTKLNNTVIVDDKGRQDTEMAKQNQTNKIMTYMMPLMSVYIGFVAPAGLSIYWIVQGLFSLVQDYFLTKHYKKIYDAEDAVKQAEAAKEAALEAERERQRALRRAENPDGMVGSASKKKQQQRERNEQAAKEAAYQEKRAAEKARDSEPAAEPVDTSRPNRRGRNYDPNRYKTDNDSSSEN